MYEPFYHENSLTNEPVGVNAATPQPIADLTLTQPLKSLRERGISAATKTHFGILDYGEEGLRYPTRHLDGSRGPERLKGMSPGQAPYSWSNSEAEKPAIYNVEVLGDPERLKGGLYLVQGEADCWPMEFSGLAAVALFESHLPEVLEANAQVLAKFLTEGGVNRCDAEYEPSLGCAENPIALESAIEVVNLLFDHNAAGRTWALAVKAVLEALGLTCRVLSLVSWPEVPLGFSVTDLFAKVGCDAIKFREAVEMLPIVASSMLQRWTIDPTEGLPAAKSVEDELYPCLDEKGMLALPEPACLVSDVLLAAGVTLLTGKENLGKSAIAIALGASISLGIPWNGQSTNPGLVFYIAAEGARGIHKRLLAWKKAMGIESTPLFRVLPLSVPLHDPAARERLIQTIEYHTAKAQAEALARGEEVPDVALVVVDTLAKTKGLLDENSQNDMTLYLEGLSELQKKVGPSVLVLHHNGKSGEYRGSSSLTANADGHLMVIGESASPQILLKVAKLKDFADGRQFVLRRRIVELGIGPDGKVIASVVFERDLEAEAELLAENGEEGDELMPKQKTTLRALTKLSGENNGVGIASNVWLKAASLQEVSKPTFDKAKKRLLEVEAVFCEKAGTQHARFTPNPDYKL